ncbi:MAG: hypothetical protein WC627_01470 [Legionella sp.]|jgi:hypothetical protein
MEIKIIYLAYIPKDNGRNPTEATTKLIAGYCAYKYNNKDTQYGLFWYQYLGFTESKLSAIKNKMREVQDNKRHYGDNPKPT